MDTMSCQCRIDVLIIKTMLDDMYIKESIRSAYVDHKDAINSNLCIQDLF